MTIADVLENYSSLRVANRAWRKGQTLFNALYEIYPELADEMRGTQFDPFYDDSRFHIALSWIAGRCDE